MRTIKFKAKRIDNGEWVYGTPVFYLSGEVALFTGLHPKMSVTREMRYKINPSTLCQFTGLHDKDGKEIWEGDYVTYELSDGTLLKASVFFDTDKACFCFQEHFAGGITNWNVNSIDLEKRCTVIGNIHDKEQI